MAVSSLRILVDNRASDDRLGFEHGWSVWIETDRDGGWLWDTGQTGLIAANAAACGIDPVGARGIALSHGHYDHTGGLPALVQAGYAGPVVGHPDVWLRRYSRRDATTYRSVGMDDSRLAGDLPGFRPAGDIRELAPGLTFVTGIRRRPECYEATANLFRDTAGQRPDTVPDDAFLLIDAPTGPLLLLGCCHAGLANSLAHARQRLGLTAVPTVVGGLHLGGASQAALAETAQALREFGVRRLYPGHCTSEPGFAFLREHFRGELTVTGSGLTIVV